MPRHRTVEPTEVVDIIERGANAADASRLFNVSRMRITQILQEHAPHLLSRHKETEPDPALEEKHQQERAELLRVLGSIKLRKDVAAHFGLTTSGLYSRMHRLGIDYKSRGAAS